MAKLLIHDALGGRAFELVGDLVTVGREADNDLRLPDASVSRHHCRLRHGAQGWSIEDLQSSNGVLVNEELTAASPLRNGDQLTLGQVQLSFQEEA
jgi:pSer/pThr/pTyr-binding forkhead associated (FHA) protein